MVRNVMRRHTLVGALAAVAASLAVPAAAQETPLLSLADGLRHVAKMHACARLWNLFVAETQNETDPKGEFDLSSILVDMHSSDPKSLSDIVRTKFGTDAAAGSDICGWFSVLDLTGNSVTSSMSLRRALLTQYDDEILPIIESYFNAVGVGGAPDKKWPAQLQRATDHYTASIIQKLSTDDASGPHLELSDLRLIIHEPAVLTGELDGRYAPVAGKTRTALKYLYPN